MAKDIFLFVVCAFLTADHHTDLSMEVSLSRQVLNSYNVCIILPWHIPMHLSIFILMTWHLAALKVTLHVLNPG